MTAPLTDEAEGLMTVDELATACGLTVRTTRYYASLGLVPPPVRRGRMAYYDQVHLARVARRDEQPSALVKRRRRQAGALVGQVDLDVCHAERSPRHSLLAQLTPKARAQAGGEQPR